MQVFRQISGAYDCPLALGRSQFHLPVFSRGALGQEGEVLSVASHLYNLSRLELSFQDSFRYFVFNWEEEQISLPYVQLPEEYAIFSEIDNSFFSLTDTEQHRFLSLCLQHLKTQLLNLYIKLNVVRVLPKLSITFDKDGAIVLNWAYTSFRVYFNFETVVENSYYGIVAQNSEDTIFSNAGKLNDRNYALVINNILQYVIENS